LADSRIETRRYFLDEVLNRREIGVTELSVWGS
jgi:hypothetical protein